MSDDMDTDVLIEMKDEGTGRTVSVIPVDNHLIISDDQPLQIVATLDPTRLVVMVSKAMLSDMRDEMGMDDTLEWVVTNSILMAENFFSVQEI